jgi:hypothetical protein
MPAALTPKITNAGLAAAISASGSGLQLAITHVALGTGSYSSATSGAAMTALVAIKEVATIASGFVGTSGSFSATVHFPAWTGVPSAYNATEIGFYAGDPTAGGILFAVYSDPSTTVQARTSASEFLATFNLQLTSVPAGSITINVDPSAAMAAALLAAHVAQTNPHPQYVRKLASGVALPTADQGVIWHEDYNSLMKWQTFNANGAAYAGYASIAVGRLTPDSQPTPRTGCVKVGSMNLSKSGRAQLWNWALHNGLVVPVASWTIGMWAFSDNGDGTFRSPDVRGDFSRIYSDGSTVDSGRVFTDHQDAYAGYNTFSFVQDDGDNSTGSYRSVSYVYINGVLMANLGQGGGTVNTYPGDTRPRNFAQLGSIQS